ncbi:MAG: hypothetical protein JJ975_12120 [Bacteroidia bacterium]|nr:hypothetical protein [Bacteroidia bacterium]
MKKLGILLVGLVVGLSAFGQNGQLAKDLAAINHAYFNLNKKMVVKAVATHGDQQVTTNYVAYMKGIDAYYMKSEGTEMLVSSSVKVVLNKATNSVMIDSNATNSVDELPIQLFDTLTKLYSSVKVSNLGSGIKRYELVPVIDRVNKIVIEFNSNTKLLRSMRMTSTGMNNEKSSMSISYTYEPLKPSDIPPISKFLTFDDEGIAQLTSAYKSYRLINFLNR